MEKYNEIKYIPMLGLPKLKQISSGYVCSCPICHEGRSPWKTRLFILTQNKSFITVFCQNCGYDTNLKSFIKQINPYLFEDYKKEERIELLADLRNGTLQKKAKEIDNGVCKELDFKYIFNLNKTYFKPAREYSACFDFCKKRNIIEHIDRFYYNIHPNHVLSGMIIFPFQTGDESLYGFQGRHTTTKKFHTHSKNDSAKIFNLFNVELDDPVYIFESIIDSLMLENSIAMLGVTISEAVSNKIKDQIFILDNDKRGIDTSIKYAEENKKIFIYPNSFKYKDFNEAVCAGMPKKELKDMVDSNIFEGFQAVVKLKLIKRSRKF
jgi:hypothetical protein